MHLVHHHSLLTIIHHSIPKYNENPIIMSRITIMYQTVRLAQPLSRCEGDRIEPTRMKWMAFPNALQSEPASFGRAMHLYRLKRIGRAGWIEAAGRWLEWGYRFSIKVNRSLNQSAAHIMPLSRRAGTHRISILWMRSSAFLIRIELMTFALRSVRCSPYSLHLLSLFHLSFSPL